MFRLNKLLLFAPDKTLYRGDTNSQKSDNKGFNTVDETLTTVEMTFITCVVEILIVLKQNEA